MPVTSFFIHKDTIIYDGSSGKVKIDARIITLMTEDVP